jgi:exonuclease SbcD
MRILHTSDWHLGHVLKDQDRDEEHRAFLAWLLGVLDSERIDVLLVTGDVFEGANPPATAQALWYGFLGDAARRCPGIQVVAIGGNHDSAGRLEAPAPILSAIRATVVGVLPRAGDRIDTSRLLVQVRERGSEAVEGWVAAVPYLRLADVPGGDPASPTAVVDGVRRVYDEALTAARALRKKEQALIVTGHCLVEGMKLSAESERAVLGGNTHPLPVDLFPEDVTYAALGHLHYPQAVGSRKNVRYAGSPIPLALDEDVYPHQVVVVEIEKGRLVDVRTILVPRSVDILRLPETGPRALEEVLELLRQLPAAPPRLDGEPDRRPYLEVRVRVERANALLNDEIREALEGRDARLLKITTEHAGTGQALADSDPVSLTDLDPEKVFRKLWERTYEAPLPPDLLAAFHELVERAHGEEAS